ncbi:MAG: hypothetical protein VKI81_04015 [Synechococcaceae cyanobacterium]|nr:hypothetical protein [Synechococcaceae cyanobacterium]
MPWWLDLVFLGSAVVLWSDGSRDVDDAIGLLKKILAVTAVMVVLLGGRQVPLELAAVALALLLPSAARFDQGDRL